MQNFFFAVLLTVGSAMLVGQTNEPQPSQASKASNGSASSPNQEKLPVKRVRAKLDGFDLAPKKSPPQENTQVAGASRGLGSAGEVRLHAPNKARVYSLTPLFEWQVKNPAQRFRFRIYEEDELIYEADVGGSSMRYPATAPALRPGTTYRWTVYPKTALLGGPVEEAEIVMLTASERQEVITKLQRRDADPAETLFDLRLWYDAMDACQSAISKNPEEARLYELRGSLYYQIDATQALAKKDFDTAQRLMPKR